MVEKGRTIVRKMTKGRQIKGSLGCTRLDITKNLEEFCF